MEQKPTEPKETAPTPKPRVPIHKTREIIRKLPQQKPHIEFISALLTIPVLITVLLLNLNNLKTKPAITITPTPTNTAISPTPIKQKTTSQSTVTSIESTATPQLTIDPNQCIKDIGPIDISYPTEGQIVNNNPLCININYTSANYCAVVWAYKINGGPLSDYANNSVCYNNLPSGSNTFTLQVKSLVSNINKTIDRHFFYQTNTTPTQAPSLQPTTSATSSASTH